MKLAVLSVFRKLDQNELTGSIQDGVEFMFWRSPLMEVNLTGNQLQGTLPSGWNGLLQLKLLYDLNHLKSCFYIEFCDEFRDLNGNAFHGLIPNWNTIPQIEEM